MSLLGHPNALQHLNYSEFVAKACSALELAIAAGLAFGFRHRQLSDYWLMDAEMPVVGDFVVIHF